MYGYPTMNQQINYPSMMNNAGQIQQLLGMLGGKGLNPEQAVRNICKQKGINVDEFMSQLK